MNYYCLQNYLDTSENRSFELPGAKPHYNPDRPGQVQHIFLDLDLDLERQRVAGICDITLQPLRPGVTELCLDAVDLEILQVTVGAQPQPFDHDGQQLRITLQTPTTTEPFTVAIAYQVEHPQRGIYFIAPNDHYPDKPVQVWTQGEDEDSRFWFPCFDYPGQLATSEIRVAIPQGYQAISNGVLLSQETTGEKSRFHWRQDQVHPTYLMTLAVGDFAEISDRWQDIPLGYYVEKGQEESARLSMGKTPGMMDFLSKTYGYKYPFPKYAQVCVDDFIFGGMENTSTTLLTDRCLLDARAAEDNLRTETLVLHELAHQWFGDLVVIKHWSHAWIKEGMATYAEVLWMDHEYGPDEAAYYLLEQARNYLAEDRQRYRRPIVTNVYREAIELYDRHLYEKGACVYHMVKTILGPELFAKAIAHFVHTHAHQTVETVDLLRAIADTTGYNLEPLFDQYVMRGGHPDFKVAHSWDGENKLAKVTITQTQAQDQPKELFNLKVPLAFGFLAENDSVTLQTFTLHLSEYEQSFYFPLAQKPSFLSFDHGNHHLKTVELAYGVPELIAQLRHCPDPIGRIYAAIALGKKANYRVLQALKTALETETFWAVRAEITQQLGKVALDQGFDLVKIALADEHPRVRRAAIQALTHFKNSQTLALAKEKLTQGDRSYYNEAAINRTLGSLVTHGVEEEKQAVFGLLKTQLDTKQGWNEVVRSGAIAGISQIHTPEAAEVILNYTALGIPQTLRLGAIRALGGVIQGQEKPVVQKIFDRLEILSKESFFLTQVATVAALGQMDHPQAIALLNYFVYQSPDGRVKRIAEEAIKRVQKRIGKEQAIGELREALEKLKQENQGLKSRLEELEAKSS